MKQSDQKSAVMKAASSAATRTVNWSPAKQDFANRVTASGSMAQKAASTRAKNIAASTISKSKK
jgi:hypothetical protein